jgi:hypothetical protein
MTAGDEIYQIKVTVGAMKLLLGRLFALHYKQLNLDPSTVSTMHETLISNWSKLPLVKSLDPAVSDVASGDVLEQMRTFLQGVEKDFLAMK